MMLPTLLLSACVRIIVGNGHTTSEVREVGEFSRIEVAGTLDVAVTGSETRAVTVTCDEDLQPYIQASVDGDTLVLGEAGEHGEWVALRPEGPCDIAVLTPTLDRLTLSGSASVRVEDGEGAALSMLTRVGIPGSGIAEVRSGTAGDALEIDISGSGAVLFDSVSVDELDIDVSGSGTVEAGGNARRERVDVSGSGNVRAREVSAAEVDASIPGSGHVEVTATDRIEVDVSGSGSIEVWGNPAEREEDISGSGSVVYHDY